jgi:hypothetical protein
VTTIMLEIPEELNGMVPALRGVVSTVMTQVERGRTGGAVDYGAFQREVAEKLGAVERSADEAALSALDVNAPRILIDKVLHGQVVRSATRFMGLAGPAKVTRSLYRPVGRRNAPVVDPVALRSGAVLGEWLPATAREMAFEVQQRTSRVAEKFQLEPGPLREDRGHVVGYPCRATEGRRPASCHIESCESPPPARRAT